MSVWDFKIQKYLFLHDTIDVYVQVALESRLCFLLTFPFRLRVFANGFEDMNNFFMADTLCFPSRINETTDSSLHLKTCDTFCFLIMSWYHAIESVTALML